MEDWCKIEFGDSSSNPIGYAENFYMWNGSEYDLITEIEIPETVTSIGDYQFRGFENLTSITIPSSVTSIGSYAFSSCSSLAGITIPSSVTSIGSYAFEYCRSLTSVTIPSSVTSIGSHAFSSCSSLTSITIPSSVTSIGSYAFFGCRSLQDVYYNGTIEDWCKIAFGGSSSNPIGYAENFYMWNGSEYDLITELEIPETVTSIGAYQFSGFENLTSITIPSSVTSIGSYAFYGCSSLTNITIPSSVISIESSAFESCEKLYIFFTGIKTDTQLGDNWNPGNRPAFWSTTITKSNAEFYFDIKEGKAIISRYLGDAESVVIPDIVTIDGINYPIVGLASGTFATNKISHLVIGCNIVQIDFDIFDQLKYLQTLVIADNNENFKVVNDAIYDITGKTLYKVLSYASCEYVVTDGTELINSYAFANNSNIVSVTIPRSVNFIGSLAFLNMTSNQEFTVHSQNEKYTSVDGILMSKDQTELICYPSGKKMQSLDISTNVNYIHNLAFEGCRLAVLTLSLDNLGEIEFKDYLGNNGLIQNLILTSTTNIFSGTFEDCMIVNVTIPSSVTSIGSYAFYYCSSLTNITIPNSVTSIGDRAFYGCSSLTTVTFGENSQLENIGSYAFEDCSSLQDVYYNGTIEDWCNIEFDGSSSNPMKYAENFYMRNGSEYDLITELEIPETVTSIGDDQFYGFKDLVSITIPSSVTSIGFSAFYDCSSLQDVYYNGTIEDWCKIKFGGWYANPMAYAENFYMWNGSKYELVTEIEIPETVTSIGAYQFYEFKDLTSITIPSGVTSIGWGAFSGCSSLASLTIPNSVKIIDSYAFENCSSLVSITIPNSVTSIGRYAFSGCSSLTTVTFGENSQLESIGSYAFYNCSSLTSITIPSSVTSIGSDAFSGCSSLTGITIPSSVTSIGSSVFDGCSSLTTVTFGENSQLESIGSYAFYNCSSLTSITIPSSVTSIGWSAFYGCSSLSEVYYGGTSEQWEEMSIGSNNGNLTGATIYYYSAVQPTTTGNYWHYVDGVPTKWN